MILDRLMAQTRTGGGDQDSAAESMSVDDFAAQHPAINAVLFVEPARAAFALHHESPAEIVILQGDTSLRGFVRWSAPDPRTCSSMERPRIIEHGAIVMAGLMLSRFEGKQITRVCERRSHVDYFVGDAGSEKRWILEVSGTEDGSMAALRARKHEQIRRSRYQRPPHNMSGFVAVTRFAEGAITVLDYVPAEKQTEQNDG